MGSRILGRVVEIFPQNLEMQTPKHTMEQIVILYYAQYIC
jgi:hypothetical protein